MLIILGITIVCLSLIWMQKQNLQYQLKADELEKGSGDLGNLKEEFNTYKKRVDALTAKAGFKL